MAKKIILAVDDMSENLTLLRTLLQDHFDIRLVKSAKMALALLDNLRVDLILLDIEMPGMSGFDFLKRLVETHPDNKHTPVIFVTSHADKDFFAQAVNSGARDYLLKPIKAETLYKKIDAVIGMPAEKTVSGQLEEKLNDLIAAAASGDSMRAESLTKELLDIAAAQDLQIRYSMDLIAKLIMAFDYEQGIAKIREFLHNLYLKRKW